MRQRLLCLALLATMNLAATVITNGSFETPGLSPGNYIYNITGATWTFTGDSGITANNSAWGFLNAPDGVQVAFLQAAGSPGSTISETITSVNAGDVISFDYAQRPSYGLNPFDVLYNGNSLGTFTPASTSWVQGSVTIPNGALSSGTLMFESLGTGGGDNDTGIDFVTATAASTPEPGPFALVLIGAGALVWRYRRA